MATFQYDQPSPEQIQAFRSVGLAKNIFLLLVILSLLAALGSVVAEHSFGVLDAVSCQTTTQQSSAQQCERAGMWRACIAGGLALARVVAPAACILLAVTLFFASNLSLLARTRGTAGYISGFFWSLVLLVMLLPWQEIVPCLYAAGAIPAMDEVVDKVCGFGNSMCWDVQVLYYARFMAYPTIAVLVALAILIKTHKAFKSMTEPSSTSPFVAKPQPPASPQA